MKLFFNSYSDLLSNLSDISEVSDYSLSSEDTKNIIFRITGEKVELIGFNRFITLIRTVDPELVSVDNDNDEPFLMSIRSKELVDFLNSYKGLRKTEVKEISLELINDDKIILCKVLERQQDEDESPIQVDDSGYLVSTWSFNNLGVKPNMLPFINKVTPEVETEVVSTQIIKMYTSELLPLIQQGTNLYSKVSFGADDEDYAVVFNQALLMFMRNYLGSAFKGVCLSYTAVSFIDKVICQYDSASICKTDTDIYFQCEGTKAFISYDNRLPDYKMYISMLTKECYFTVDRLYLKDILRRLSLLKDNVEVHIDIENSTLHLKNSKFNQEIQILNMQGMEGIEKRNFKIMPDVLSKAFLSNGEDDASELYIYYAMQANKTAILQFGDEVENWFSSVSIKPY